VKHYCWLTLLLLASLAWGQETPAPPPPQTGSRPPGAGQPPQVEQQEAPAPQVATSKVPPTAPVITVQGLCPAAAASSRRTAIGAKTPAKTSAASSGCRTVITRAQFERLAGALNPDMPLATKRQLAEAYPRLLLFAQKAREMGVDKDPQFQEMMKFATMQLLAQNLTRNLQKKAGDLPQAEIEKYYNDNPEKFQEVELLRIFVPKSKQTPPAAGSTAPAKPDTAADEAAMKATAEKIHSEAAAGGDFQKLQQEAFDAAGIKSQSPSVNLGKITREGLPANHQKVFELQAGQVSELLDDPGGYYIYKVVSKQKVPLDQAKGEIHNVLQQQAFRQQMEAMINSVKPELNQAYFGGAGQPAAPGIAPQRPKPPAGNPGTPPSQK
jgi:DNA polymerase III gamma/tau subunit